MTGQFARTELLLGKAAMERLRRSRVAVFGIGGVGGHVCEALARSGIGAFDLVDDDRVSLTNLNRQIIAAVSTLGRCKVDVMRERILDINPEAEVRVHKCFFLPENAASFPFAEYDYVVDAVDTVTAKLALILRAKECGTPIISSMGAGNKLDATAFRVADIYETKVCPLAKVMRRELKKRGVESLKVVYSEEIPLSPNEIQALDEGEKTDTDKAVLKSTDMESEESYADSQNRDARRRSIPGSIAFVPSVAGLIIAGEVIKDLAMDN
ncbi:MAG: tRNA threonylcarbamoyladenosine dehydratase [Lachnospiraceae bacterium]|nr:tRNA threonylcarbamoyladenosine dehydratase [uncultured Acetatifactor sp.]MCI9219856.1 tRNA threonylcarbamoyladenosine dehydratase [Lachnospiraceae bacterium]